MSQKHRNNDLIEKLLTNVKIILKYE